MEVLFQIGKELAALEARVKKIEGDDCGCKSRTRGVKDANLPKEQQAVVKQLRSNHADIFAAFNKVLKDFKLPPGLAVGRFNLMDKADLVGVDDEDRCCMSCLNGSGGYEYCCDYAGCSCCD